MFISSELDEVLRTSHRIVVLRDRVKVNEFAGEVDESPIMQAMAGSDDVSRLRDAPAWQRIRESKLVFPLIVLGVILLFDLVFDPGFFELQIIDGHLFGNLDRHPAQRRRRSCCSRSG